MIFAMLAAVVLPSEMAVNHTFSFAPNREDVRAVALVGTFNGWNATATPMVRAGNAWKAQVELSPGRHAYKFVVNNTEWIPDPLAKNENDGVGNINSILLILPPGYDRVAKIGDAEITESVLRSTINADQGELTIRLRMRPNDVAKAEVRVWKRADSSAPRRVEMRTIQSDEIFELREATLAWDGKSTLDYDFDLQDGDLRTQFGETGLVEGEESKKFALVAATARFPKVPNWVEDTVFYQIFPDRFENGNLNNDPKDKAEWSARPEWFNRFGGDVAGIRKRMSHLVSLGVNGIYLNPVMAAPSNHRYDPCDFFTIDPEFGTNAEYAAMTKALLAKGIRTVQDQIFDHVGVDFPAFKDLLKNQQNSKYKDWFFVKKWPVEVKQNPNYEAWFGAESMPKINVQHPEVKKYFWDSLSYWRKNASISGWRLDVANEVPMEFWRDFRKQVKGLQPDAWIVGEVWGQATGWLQGDQWDASMNYPFRDAMMKFVATGATTPTQAQNQLFEIYNWYAPQVSRNQLNLLSSHDTARFLTEAGNDWKKQMLAATVQMTWVGSPSIYYGEELGMEGMHDPDNRRGMTWSAATADNAMLQYYRKLIGIRRQNPVLAKGSPVRTACFDSQGVLTFGRKHKGMVALVAVNRSQTVQKVVVPLAALGSPRSLSDALTGSALRVDPRTDSVHLDLPPQSAVVALPTPERRGASRVSRELSRRNGNHTEAI